MYGTGVASSGYGSRVGVVCGAGLLKRNIGIVSRAASYFNFGYATDSVTLRGRGIFSCYGHGGYGASTISSRVSVVCGAGLLKRNIGIVSRGASYAYFSTDVNPEFTRCRGFFGRSSASGYSNVSYGTRVTVVCGAGLLKGNMGIVSRCFLLRFCLCCLSCGTTF